MRLGIVPTTGGPREPRFAPRATILEAARLADKRTGLVATCDLTHATPAAFAAHALHRKQSDTIAEQLLHQKIDVLLGGGRAHAVGTAARLEGVLADQGFTLRATRAELAVHGAGRLAGLFADRHMEAALDRGRFDADEPSLPQMTAKALELLEPSPEGFFLLIEGSQVDWGGHSNDPAHLLGDLLEFDEAVGFVLGFARRRADTLVVVASDHATGGITLGNDRTSNEYALDAEEAAAPLRRMKLTADGLLRTLDGDSRARAIGAAVRKHWGADLPRSTLAQAAEQLAQDPTSAALLLARAFSHNATIVGWTTSGHTGADVPLFAFGPGAPSGSLDIPALGRHLARELGLDLEAATRRLFIDARELFGDAERSVVPPSAKAPSGALRVRRDGAELLLPFNRNYALRGETRLPLEGVTVALLASSDSRPVVYVSADASRLLASGKARSR